MKRAGIILLALLFLCVSILAVYALASHANSCCIQKHTTRTCLYPAMLHELIRLALPLIALLAALLALIALFRRVADEICDFYAERSLIAVYARMNN